MNKGPGVVKPGEKTADGVPISQGLRVWTNNLRPGYIDLSGAQYEKNHNTGAETLWFNVIEDAYPESHGVLQSPDRVATRHPSNGSTP